MHTGPPGDSSTPKGAVSKISEFSPCAQEGLGLGTRSQALLLQGHPFFTPVNTKHPRHQTRSAALIPTPTHTYAQTRLHRPA